MCTEVKGTELNFILCKGYPLISSVPSMPAALEGTGWWEGQAPGDWFCLGAQVKYICGPEVAGVTNHTASDDYSSSKKACHGGKLVQLCSTLVHSK